VTRPRPPLVLHVIHRLAIGGLENGLVNLVNHMPADKYRHAILCIEASSAFQARVNPDVEIIELRKRPGKDWPSYHRLWRVLRALTPALMHTRNYGTLDTQVIATLSRVPCRIHGEHGGDAFDVDKTRLKCNIVRRVVSPLVHAYVTVSQELRTWLTSAIHVPIERVHYIPNGVDLSRFGAARMPDARVDRLGLGNRFLIGTVGRMEDVKNPLYLVDSFISVVRRRPDLRARLGLVLVGDGPLRRACVEKLAAASLSNMVCVPGAREDIPDVMRALDIFVLPSSAEGMSNAILEAMASAVPVIATNIGANQQTVRHGVTGWAVPSGDIPALSRAIEYYSDNPCIARQHGLAGRVVVEESFSLRSMIESYIRLYDSTLRIAGVSNETRQVRFDS
jgi:sugar transferase (PEP-CTERM/EpsH1 system associated)